MAEDSKDISRFIVAGINYKKTDASIRGQFAINPQQYETLLQVAPSHGISELFVLSTCNRTEIYGFAETPAQLINLLCTQTAGSADTFNQLCYIKQCQGAVQHLFEVGAGLDSQILGDYEIIGQMKAAARFSKDKGFVGAFSERLLNCVLQSTKVIKNQTELSGGTVSVSFAAVQYIRKHVKQVSNKSILLLGVGKIGRNTCKNLVDYLCTTNITLINRTADKANNLAGELGLKSANIDELEAQIEQADIILTATNSEEPVILKSHLTKKGKKLIIDLSIPYNVEKSAQELPNVTLINVDQLSKLRDETLQKRVAEVPKAKEIICEHIAEFVEWSMMRKNVPFIKAVKQKLHDMHNCELFISSYAVPHSCTGETPGINEYAIQRAIKNMAVKMKQQRQPGCCYIEAINEFITSHKN